MLFFGLLSFFCFFLISANRADPDEMQLYAAFHQGLRTLFVKVEKDRYIQWTIPKLIVSNQKEESISI